METINFTSAGDAPRSSSVPPPYLDPDDDADLPFGPPTEPPDNLIGSIWLFDTRLNMNLLLPVFGPTVDEPRIGLGSELLTAEQVRFLIDLLGSALFRGVP